MKLHRFLYPRFGSAHIASPYRSPSIVCPYGSVGGLAGLLPPYPPNPSHPLLENVGRYFWVCIYTLYWSSLCIIDCLWPLTLSSGRSGFSLPPSRFSRDQDKVPSQCVIRWDALSIPPYEILLCFRYSHCFGNIMRIMLPILFPLASPLVATTSQPPAGLSPYDPLGKGNLGFT